MANWTTTPLEMHHTIMESLSIVDITRLRRVNKYTKKAVDSYIRLHISAEKVLAPWFSPGQITLFTPNDLHCYVPMQYFIGFTNLLHEFGYVYNPLPGQYKDLGEAFSFACSQDYEPKYVPLGIAGTFEFVKLESEGKQSAGAEEPDEDLVVSHLSDTDDSNDSELENDVDVDLVASQLDPHHSVTDAPAAVTRHR
ncbi:hypothetical protein MPER_01446, partial [Moniliophthora perniciosa FA553]